MTNCLSIAGKKCEKIDENTVSHLVEMEKKGESSKKRTIPNGRNFLTGSHNKEKESMDFEIHVEKSPESKYKAKDPRVYCLSVPEIQQMSKQHQEPAPAIHNYAIQPSQGNGLFNSCTLI